jgi:hypothetical protein
MVETHVDDYSCFFGFFWIDCSLASGQLNIGDRNFYGKLQSRNGFWRAEEYWN